MIKIEDLKVIEENTFNIKDISISEQNIFFTCLFNKIIELKNT